MAISKKGGSQRKSENSDALVDSKAGCKSIARPGNNYLTKRVLISAAKKGFAKAAAETMQVMGFNVIVRNGWVVKKFNDGRIEKIKKLPPSRSAKTLALD